MNDFFDVGTRLFVAQSWNEYLCAACMKQIKAGQWVGTTYIGEDGVLAHADCEDRNVNLTALVGEQARREYLAEWQRRSGPLTEDELRKAEQAWGR